MEEEEANEIPKARNEKDNGDCEWTQKERRIGFGANNSRSFVIALGLLI